MLYKFIEAIVRSENIIISCKPEKNLYSKVKSTKNTKTPKYVWFLKLVFVDK